MSTSSTLSLDHHHQQQQQQQQLLPHPSEQLCYVHCNLCDTVLAVSVPCTSLFKTVTVRCGHCTNLLPVNMRALLLPSANQLHLGHNFFAPPHNLLEEMTTVPAAPNFGMMTNQMGNNTNNNNPLLNNFTAVSRESSTELLPRTPTANRPPEKRQRVPSAYNRFIKDEIQRIKAGNPDISHREAFSAAAKNWAHFPHIHFGLMPDQTVKRPATMRPQEGEGINMVKDGYFPSANVGVSPY